jgi:hypothetical protein
MWECWTSLLMYAWLHIAHRAWHLELVCAIGINMLSVPFEVSNSAELQHRHHACWCRSVVFRELQLRSGHVHASMLTSPQ